MNTDSNSQDNNQECCSSGDCACNTNKQSGGGLKTFAFYIIILAAIGIAGYSLFFKSADAGKADCVPGAVPAPLETLSSIPELNTKLGDLDFVFILMTEKDFTENSDIPAIVDSALAEIGADKSKVIRLTVDDPIFGKVADEYVITGFPAVLSLGRYGDRLLIGSGVTLETLKLAYKISATAPLPCCG